mmetsp:Transcript_6370/g.21330  ORF Transcript_6370/g.21330 Transcript_6370/m.21330 type:complete len:176 (-) Transcript_6370:145-672(-)
MCEQRSIPEQGYNRAARPEIQAAQQSLHGAPRKPIVSSIFLQISDDGVHVWLCIGHDRLVGVTHHHDQDITSIQPHFRICSIHHERHQFLHRVTQKFPTFRGPNMMCNNSFCAVSMTRIYVPYCSNWYACQEFQPELLSLQTVVPQKGYKETHMIKQRPTPIDDMLPSCQTNLHL